MDENNVPSAPEQTLDDNVDNGTDNTETQSNDQSAKPTDQCPTCDVDMLLMAASMAHIGCNALDGNDKANCMAWADQIDPDKFKAAKDIVKEMLRKTGIDGAKRSEKAFNAVIRAGIIDLVAEMLDNDEPVPTGLMGAYKQAINEQGI